MRTIKILMTALVGMMMISPVIAQDDRVQRINASYAIVSGREPAAGEVEHWKKQGDLSVQQLVNYHIQYASQEMSFKRDLISRSYQHALGRNPSEGEITYWAKGSDTYDGLMKNHISWLKGNPGEYEKVIKASYVKSAIRREPNLAEIDFWKKQDVYSFAVLVQCHNDYVAGPTKGVFKSISSAMSSVMKAVKMSSSISSEVSRLMGIAGGSQVLAQGAAGVTSMLGPILPFFNLSL